MAFTEKTTWVDLPSTTTPVMAADILRWERGIAEAHAMLASMVPLRAFTGANDSAKFRDSLSNAGGRVVVIPPNTTLDSGANNPFILPTGFHMMSVPGPEDEFGYTGTVNIRHTGSTTTLGVFQFANGSKGQKFSGISFKGTSSTRMFVDVATDGSDGRFPQYINFYNCSFNQMESVYTGTGTGIKIMGAQYTNNMACTRPPLFINGSDHTLFSNGGLMEMGGVATYATRAANPAMVRGGNCSNTSIGPVYWTGSPGTVFRLDGGTGGVNCDSGIFEGRPSHQGTLWCAGPLARLTAGRSHWRMREHGYAMRAPADTGYNPGGFWHVEGGDHAVDGGTFTPYSAGEYPAYTLPNGTTKAAGTQPHFAWVTGSSTRLKVTNITRGANATTIPIVMVPAASTANVVTDGTVQVVTY